MSTPTEDNDFGYVSPADFDEPGDKEDDIKPRDEVDLPVLEEVLRYLDREIDNCTRISSLIADKDTNLSIEQQLAVQEKVMIKLQTARTHIKAVIEGIDEKYDETRR